MDQLPLKGIRVVEMSHMVMGPTCGMLLATLGADVIKVEPPAGDKTRELTGMATSFFPLFNRGKRSIVLDLASDDGREALDRLLATADVFVENFKDETIARNGIQASQLAERYPRLIIAAHKGFLSGPYEHRPALDEVVQMMTGLAHMTGLPGKPLRVGASVNDIMGGMFGVIGVLSALRDRDRTGRGTEVRIGLFENCLFTVAQHIVQFQMTGIPVPPMAQKAAAWPVYDIFETADGRKLFVAATTSGQWQAFCTAFGFEDLLTDPELQTVSDRILARPKLIPRFALRIAQDRLDVLLVKLDELGLPFAPINAPEDLLDDPHVRRPGGLVEMRGVDDQIIKVPALPLEFDQHSIETLTQVPLLGGDTMNVLTELGYSSAEAAVIVGRTEHAA
ncbi:CoA transferase [Sphingobium terrigena]|uniref:CoA transferase n=1 Tax=Sphingobium terrigena TaxID=2304063 RepID=A0A418YXS9_9SPHN|nr:CoA transferase [Sphingobium terrigena]RJG57656.1 CoA transferase [Sphingobium terrigena]